MLEPLVRAALLEDLGRAGDLTTDAIVPAQARVETALVARQPGVVAGLDLALLPLPWSTRTSKSRSSGPTARAGARRSRCHRGRTGARRADAERWR